MKIPEDWEYIKFTQHIRDHCQICDKETSRLHWYRMNRQQVATVCEHCQLEHSLEHEKGRPSVSISSEVDSRIRHHASMHGLTYLEALKNAVKFHKEWF